MHRYIARANIDDYLVLLNDHNLAPEKRAVITKLLIEAADRLSYDIEHLDFFESRAANGRDQVRRVRMLRESFAFGSPEREQAERVVANVENLQTILENACHRLRAKVARTTDG